MSPFWSRQAKALQAAALALAGALALGGVAAIVWPDAPSDPASGVLAVLEGAPGPLLSHGDDALPPRPPSPTPNAAGLGWPCEGDGTDGKRVQVVAAGPSRVELEQIARQVEVIFAGSSDGRLLVRFVTEGDCALSIVPFAFSPAAGQSFDATINDLNAAGLNRADRKYLVFTDSAAYCGIGTVTADDSPGSQNAANGGPSYSRVDRGCRNAFTAAHELVHNLGGVQLTAPNSTGGWHCSDALDVMCYADGAANDDQRAVCPASERERLDCRRDDYFTVTPSGYLASHWNVAMSGFLASGASPTTQPPPTAPPTTVAPTTSTTTGKGKTTTDLNLPSSLKVNQDVRVTASVSGNCDPTGTVEFRVSGNVVSRQVLSAGEATTTLRFTRPGRFTIRATFVGSDRCASSSDSVRKRVTA